MIRQKGLLCPVGLIDYWGQRGRGGSRHLEVWNSKRKRGIRILGDKRSEEEKEKKNKNQRKPTIGEGRI